MRFQGSASNSDCNFPEDAHSGLLGAIFSVSRTDEPNWIDNAPNDVS